MSMAHGLEVRVPFVDHVLLDAVWPDLGAHPSLMRNKRLLHETLSAAAAAAKRSIVRSRDSRCRSRRGWPPIFNRSSARAWRYLVDAGWIAPGVPDATWSAWQRGAAHWSRPWALGMLGEFLRTM